MPRAYETRLCRDSHWIISEFHKFNTTWTRLVGSREICLNCTIIFISLWTKMTLFDWINDVTWLPSKFLCTVIRKFRRQWPPMNSQLYHQFKNIGLKSKCPRRNKTLVRFGTDRLQKHLNSILKEAILFCQKVTSFYLRCQIMLMAWQI